MPGGLTRETTADRRTPSQLAIATFNVENLAPSDPPTKFDGLAGLIVDNLEAPDIVALEEIQDNNGATDDGVVDAPTSHVQQAHRGDHRRRRADLPVPLRSTRSTTRTAASPAATSGSCYLFRTDRGLSFVDRPGRRLPRPPRVTGPPARRICSSARAGRPDERGLDVEPEAAGGGVRLRAGTTCS